MRWVVADFKGKKVWAGVLPTGELAVEGARVPIRYSEKAGAKIYRAGVSNLARQSEVAEELPEGINADADPRKKTSGRGSGFGSAGTRTQAQAAAAKQSAEELISSFRPDAAVCFTDGACKGNPGPAGSGAVVKLPDGEVLERAKALGVATNNVGELTAIDVALDLLDEAAFPLASKVEICTDSKYTFGLLELGWKAKSNQELVRGIKNRLSDRNVQLHWVAGHVGLEENERADVLANQGVEESLRE
jgi:ribonuclease HI